MVGRVWVRFHHQYLLMSTRAEVEALVDLIRDSALKALDEYEKYGGPVPHLQSAEHHPLDRAENKLGFKKIIGTLEGACEQLCSTLASPTQTILNVRSFFFTSMS